MRPTRAIPHIAPRRAAAVVYALTVSISLVASPLALRAQAIGDATYAPAIASTGSFAGAPSGVSADRRASGDESPASDRAENASVLQSPWTADRSLPDIAGQLRPQHSPAEQTGVARSSADFSHAPSESGQVVQSGDMGLANQVATASAAAPLADAAEMPAASEAAFAQTSAGVQHIPLAPPSKRQPGDQPQTSGSTLQMLVSIISSLLLVVGLFLGVAWCYRKTLGTSLTGGLPKQVVSILGRTSISARQQLVLVRFGSKLLLVSVIQGEARTLGEISDPLEVDQMLGQCESGQPGSITQSFKSLLHAEEM